MRVAKRRVADRARGLRASSASEERIALLTWVKAAGVATWASWTNAAEEAAGIGADFEERSSAIRAFVLSSTSRVRPQLVHPGRW